MIGFGALCRGSEPEKVGCSLFGACELSPKPCCGCCVATPSGASVKRLHPLEMLEAAVKLDESHCCNSSCSNAALQS